jgi:glyoxylase-like metal-dependent hydrolase (beta-lactamase superfamily II)/rhodanese-related sulfurtransferase
MKIEQIYTGCLAQGSYYIESNGESAIVDPLREVDQYIALAKSRNTTIKYIFETLFQADFVSGHVTLSEKTGAPIVYGPTAETAFDAIIATDNQEFKIGDITIKILHTPGHTMESTTYLVIDENGKEHAIFSGDTLFLGDVGRPDLAQKAASMTQEELAGLLFDSLRNKIMTLPDDLIVYPGHGAGSACGKNMSKETVGNLGDQKQNNYALRADMTKAEFVQELTDGLGAPPAYFPLNVQLNKSGYEDIDTVIERGMRALSPAEFEAAANETEALILDVRPQSEFVLGHIPRSIFIGIDGGFAPWVGALIKDTKQAILLVASIGKEAEVITRLSRVGFDNTIGILKGGFDAWKQENREVDTVESISVEEFKTRHATDQFPIFDVRKDGEYQSEYAVGAIHTALSRLNNHLSEYPTEGKFYVHCAGGYRSVIAASILKSRGIHNMINIEGGFDAMVKSGIEFKEFVCPSTLK